MTQSQTEYPRTFPSNLQDGVNSASRPFIAIGHFLSFAYFEKPPFKNPRRALINSQTRDCFR